MTGARRFWGMVCGCLALAMPAWGASGAFSVEEKGGDFQVLHRGKVLMESVVASSLPDGGLGLEPKASKAVLPDGTRVWNRWSEHRDTRIRLEVALKGDGSSVEITMVGECEAYAKYRSRGLELRMPGEAVAGCSYEGLIQTGREWQTDQGTMASGKARRGRIGRGQWRYLGFRGGDAAASGVVFDFNPIGPGEDGLSYVTGVFRGIFLVAWEKDGRVRVAGGGTQKERGGMVGAKLVLREGEFATDYPAHHALRTYHYPERLPLTRLYSFGAKKHGKMYQSADTAAYDAKKGFGWLGKPRLKASQAAPEGALYAAVSGKDATFRMDGLYPGLHIVQVSCGNFGGAPNRFSVAVNGREIAAPQNVARCELLNLAVPVWTLDGTIDVRFGGEFLVSAIGDAFLMAQAEDFTYQRGYWVSDGYEPSDLYQNADAKPQAVFAVSSERIPMPVPGEAAAGPLKAMTREKAPMDPASPGLAWAKQAVVRHLGYNTSTMNEYRDPAVLSRALDELQKQGATAVWVSGMHSRHTYPRSLERGKAMLEQIAQAAHARGMKVIDHHDATLCWQSNAGFRTIAERLGESVRALPDMVPSASLCIMNPVFTRTYRDYLLDLLRRGVDGLQCDEVYFFQYFCGCAHCRAKFHEATGWWLPLNELDPSLMNRKAPLWKAYLEWRKKALVDWFVEFRKEANAVNPDFVQSTYTTHYGFADTYASLCKGNDLIEGTRAFNYFGTEVMPRNPLACARPLVPYRKMYNLLREASGIPLWAVMYGANHETRYFGWAACNLAAQCGFVDDGADAKEVDFLTFGGGAENMVMAEARPTAKVALLFSQHSRDWNFAMSMHGEILGQAQTLEELHIPYRFFAELSLTAEKLKDIQVLSIGAAGCLADADIQAILRFAEKGGTVLMTGVAGLADEMGNQRKTWPFARYFQFTPRQVKNAKLARLGTRADGADAFAPAAGRAWFRPTGKGANPSRSPLYGFDETGKAWPLVFEAKCGKGRLVYQAAPIALSLFADEVAMRKPWDFELDEPLARMYRRYLLEALDGASPWRVEAPTQVFAELYRHDGALVAHFLNATGATLKKGEIVQPEPPHGVAWPALAEDIRFTLEAPQAREVYAVSPDFAGRKPLPFTRDGAKITVTLPRKLLKAYTLVWMK